MPNPDEAREQAWGKIALDWVHGTLSGHGTHTAGWDARGQYDEQRIAALVARLEAEYAQARAKYDEHADDVEDDGGEASYYDGFATGVSHALAGLRALAGQTARDEVPE